jgi:hypothetical protein
MILEMCIALHRNARRCTLPQGPVRGLLGLAVSGYHQPQPSQG